MSVAPSTHLFSEAIVLAAGSGARLRPLTDSRPKPLIELVKGVSILDIIVRNAMSLGVSRIVLVTWNHTDLFREKCLEIADRERIEIDVHGLPAPTRSSFETLRKAMPLVGTPPAVFLGDDVTLTPTLMNLVERFRKMNPAVLEAIVHEGDTASLQRTCSVEVDDSGWISAIVEKPRTPPPTMIRGCGIYLLAREALEFVSLADAAPVAGITDLVGHFASLRRAASAYVDGDNINVNTLADLQAASRAYAATASVKGFLS